MKMKSTCAAVLCCLSASAFAADIAGLEINGYSRGGGVFSYNKNQDVKGGISLGGDLHKYRLGNEGGEIGFEVNIAKTFEVDGAKFKVDYMPSKWMNNNVGTEQAYVELSGLNFSPEAKFWVGQKRQRVQDVHIVDHFLLDYGVNQGFGVNDLALGGLKLGAAVQSGDTFEGRMQKGTSANKFNLDLAEIKTNPGGTLRVLLTSVNTSGLKSSGGSGLSVSHNQTDFGVKGLTNSLFLQTSSGYANINGRFGDISAGAYGKKTNRIANSINWQSGAFGGQAVVGYQTTKSDDPMKNYTISDTSIGGRISYAVSKNFKWLAEVGHTARKFSDNQPAQSLNKVTIAPTLSMGGDFWSRPELRLFVTKANWNQAAADANANPASGFGANGRKSQTLAGVQYEVWF
jgi:maltoporin